MSDEMTVQKPRKRIWFKPDCVEWIVKGIKTTTFRRRRHEGIYEVVRGSWFKPEPVGLTLKLTPIKQMDFLDCINAHFETEGDFDCQADFEAWLNKVGLDYQKDERLGWLHKIEVVDDD